MASFPSELEYQITDVNGDSALMRLTTLYPDTTTLSGLASTLSATGALIAACTNGKVTSVGFRFTQLKAQISAGTAPPPSNATYPSVTDGARLTCANSAGGRRVDVIPAPLQTDFVAGTNTVDPGDANISALIAQIEALSDLDGSTNLYEGGVKVGRHSRRKPARKHL